MPIEIFIVRRQRRAEEKMNLVMELFACAYEAQEKIRYHHFQVDITHSESDPDFILAQALLENGIDFKKNACFGCSTSWRYEAGQTILTYLVWVPAWVIAEVPNEVIVPRMTEFSRYSGLLASRREKNMLEYALIHGLRHLRFLLFECQDPALTRTIVAAEAVHLFKSLPPEAGGRI